MRFRAFLNNFFNRFPFIIIFVSFVISFILQLMPLPPKWYGFRPAWLVLTLIYWITLNPKRVNISVAFLVGICWDYASSSKLGVHAISLVVLTYFVCVTHHVFYNLSKVLQAIAVIFMVLFVNICIFFIEFFIHKTNFYWQSIGGAVLSGILWPWFVLFNHRFNPIFRKF